VRLNRVNLADKEFWLSKGYRVPEYDIEAAAEKTRKYPEWLHIGAGNIFRIFPAMLQQRLLNKGYADKGIVVSEVFDEEILDKAYRPFDNLSIAVTLKSSGEIEKELVASIVETVKPRTEFERMTAISTAPSLQMISLTVTEKGYALADEQGKYFPWVQKDLDRINSIPASTIGIIAELCFRRYKAGAYPLALVSLDNFSHNGTVLKDAVMVFVHRWVESGWCEPGFLDYMENEKRIAFTWSMIDKITPRPAESVLSILESDGLEDMQPVETEKHTFVAPYVNAEEIQYLAIEDNFPNGRPQLEKAGVIFSDRETIDRIERMKVCTCLNPLHTVLAVFGCLLGYTSISEEMKNQDLKQLIQEIGYREGMPVVTDPGIISAEKFINEVIEIRFPNPFVPDTPQRIATDTSKKIPIRFGETLKSYIARGENDLSFLTFIPLFFAGWLRYLMGIDDSGKPFALSRDPNLDELKTYLHDIPFGDTGPYPDKLHELLSRKDIFGIDLAAYNLDEKVISLFSEMNSSPGSIAAALKKYLSAAESID